MKSSFTELFDVPFTFEKRPEPLPGEMRPNWRIAILLVLLDVSRGKKASLRKLHVLNWVIRNSQNRERFVRYVNGEVSRTNVVVRIDPALNHAIDLLRAEGLVKLVSGKTVTLTGKGKVLVREIVKEGDMLVEEIEFALIIKAHINENKIEKLLDWREIS